MSRGLFLVLAFVVLAFAIFGGWWSNRRTEFFPAELQTTMVKCDFGSEAGVTLPILDDSEVEWFSGILADVQEPSLYRRPDGRPRSVRFVWLRSFHAPVVVRVDRLTPGHLQLTARQLALGTNPDLVRPPRALTRALTPEEVRAFEAAVDAGDVFRPSSRGCESGADGSRWIIEGADSVQGYRFHQRWSPEAGKEREFGLFMLGLTGWDFEAIY